MTTHYSFSAALPQSTLTGAFRFILADTRRDDDPFGVVTDADGEVVAHLIPGGRHGAYRALGPGSTTLVSLNGAHEFVQDDTGAIVPLDALTRHADPARHRAIAEAYFAASEAKHRARHSDAYRAEVARSCLPRRPW